MNQAFYWALCGTLFTFGMTSLGAAMVFAMRKGKGVLWQELSLGFAAGVMLAATIWSLLLPSIERAGEQGRLPVWIPATIGFLAGGGFLMVVDLCLPGLPRLLQLHEKRTALLVLAVTLHNIPEGMAVGLSFALAAESPGQPELYAAAIAFALGIGIQNFPEGAAISLPLHQEGMSRLRSFVYGSLSGTVEILFGVGTVFLAGILLPYMPWLLAFAGGAMVYVVVKELIPQSNRRFGTAGVFLGFVLMMILDVSLG